MIYRSYPLLDGYRPNYRNELQGKCIRCQVRWIWLSGGIAKLKNAHCPKCGDKLERTSYRLSWPVKRTTYVHIGKTQTG